MKYCVEFEQTRHTQIEVDAEDIVTAERLAWMIMNDGKTVTDDSWGCEEVIVSNIAEEK